MERGEMRILYVTTIGGTMPLFVDLIETLVREGTTVDIACNDRESRVPESYGELGCRTYTIDCSRSPLDRGNIRAIRQIRRIVEDGAYDIVHCHTPIAAACARLACRKLRRRGAKVIYTAHGFHFYKGAPVKNWLIYFPVEWVCSWMTDVLITINKEDSERAKRLLHAKRFEYVPGVGVNLERFRGVDGSKVREEMGLHSSDRLLLSVGELNSNKNHQLVVRCLPALEPNVHYAVAGEGDLAKTLQSLAQELSVAERFHLLGYRRDVPELMAAADAYVLPSFREGLNVSLMEAMASGLPCAAGRIRGNTDLIDEDRGALFDPKSLDSLEIALRKLLTTTDQAIAGMILRCHNMVSTFDVAAIISQMSEIYISCK